MGGHKSSVERSLVAVRVRIQTALEWLDDKEIDARTELLEADQALRNIELKLAGERNRLSSPLLEDDAATSAETRKWILKNFTEHDLEVAETNVELLQSSRSSFEPIMKRSSTQQVVEEIDKAVQNPEVASLLRMTGTLNFDAIALSEQPEAGPRCLSVFGAYVVHKERLISKMEENRWIDSAARFSEAWVAFCNRLDSLYEPDAVYHSACHAVDVAGTVNWLMRSAYLRERMTPLDHFSALAAACLHDVGHPGKNNLWHSKTMSPLAVRYNDRSILENMHVALAFETMQSDEECNWFAQLRSSDAADDHHAANLKQYVRKGLISMVLATDMAKHNTQVEQLKRLAEEQKENPDADLRSDANQKTAQQNALERKLFLLETVVHGCDISNPAKQQPMMLGWTRRVLSEFWSQGDEERRLGFEVSPLCDRESGMATVPKGQLGFINFVVLPFFKPLADLIPEAQQAVDELMTNCEFWKAQDAAGRSFEEIFGAPPIMIVTPAS
mmetsp:Transcript_66923/g.139740  ORF Transcript_66923/g.139740 Transcript_66923/m.139740 type:complete len:501 (-) Transcript_66923:354-1856(-)|eukprot:CAMPEP_0206457436 /NCGR_PEP_ID=MMETSP0324_2-20121206/22958_1 /ASSEMBLY_ACC=CAM_ASM_000836 /TAXON_ID=2866 /ORGANISM="Crypthecodinium cohnii, Strain Seligo" /LENGTH=500 /DNA_ID=CAMNT_0053928553 /DNA_START=148 /DNA_END=1650 /DNA_ORIENTATION=+